MNQMIQLIGSQLGAVFVLIVINFCAGFYAYTLGKSSFIQYGTALSLFGWVMYGGLLILRLMKQIL
jgi:ABC-type uncharacterized transport system permease subunit